MAMKILTALLLMGILLCKAAKAQEQQVTDIIFAVDGSFSIGPNNFEVVKNWIKNVTNRIAALDEAGSTNFGVIQFSHWFRNRSIEDQPYIKTEIELGSIKNLTALFIRLDNITLQGFRTFTGKALNKTSLDFDNFGRPNASRFAVLFTDGKSNDPQDAVNNAQILREKGVEVITVGVGNINITELRAIASGNTSSDQNVFTVNSFSDLSTLSNIIAQTIQTSIQAEAGSSAAVTTTTTLEPTTIPRTTEGLVRSTRTETTTAASTASAELTTSVAITTRAVITTIETTKIDTTTLAEITTMSETSTQAETTSTHSTTTPLQNNFESDDDDANNSSLTCRDSSFRYILHCVLVNLFMSFLL